jgi:hypothetical protein
MHTCFGAVQWCRYLRSVLKATAVFKKGWWRGGGRSEPWYELPGLRKELRLAWMILSFMCFECIVHLDPSW